MLRVPEPRKLGNLCLKLMRTSICLAPVLGPEWATVLTRLGIRAHVAWVGVGPLTLPRGEKRVAHRPRAAL